MRCFLAACSLAFVVGAGTFDAAAQDDEGVVDITGQSGDEGGAESAKAGSGPFIKTGKPCGNKQNVYFCTTVTSADNATKSISRLTVRFPAKGTAFVTWQGSVFCPIAASRITDGLGNVNLEAENYLFLVIKQNKEPFAFNEPGSQSVGERTYLNVARPDQGGFVRLDRTILAPVSLSKSVAVKNGQQLALRVDVVPDFRKFSGTATCNVNGGVTTVQFVPG